MQAGGVVAREAHNSVAPAAVPTENSPKGLGRVSWWVKLAVGGGCILLAVLGECAPAGSAAADGVIEGRVVDSQGQPVAGVEVRMYDADSLGHDDHLADGRTDSSGHYQLRYAAGPWDCCRGLRESNPDIYAEIWQRSAQARAGWRLVDRSRVFSNHRPSAALPIDFKIAQ
jgi:hypothetical protein